MSSSKFLTYDLSLRCDGDEYRRMSAFNVIFVIGVVIGWPAFLVWYLRRIQLLGRTADDSVLERVGFLFEQYRPEYLYWDVVETVRKLYLVTVVAFFENGTMLQLVLSVIVSSLAFAYHVYALPYTDRWLNVLQGACLFMIWMSLQAGMLMVSTTPNLSAGSALLMAVSVANIIMLISPALLIVLAVLQVIPASIRTRFAAVVGLGDAPSHTLDEVSGTGSAGKHAGFESPDHISVVGSSATDEEHASFVHPDRNVEVLSSMNITGQVELTDLTGSSSPSPARHVSHGQVRSDPFPPALPTSAGWDVSSSDFPVRVSFATRTTSTVSATTVNDDATVSLFPSACAPVAIARAITDQVQSLLAHHAPPETTAAVVRLIHQQEQIRVAMAARLDQLTGQIQQLTAKASTVEGTTADFLGEGSGGIDGARGVPPWP